MIPKLLIVGCGDVGVRLSHRLNNAFDATPEIYGLRRKGSLLPAFINEISCDLTKAEDLDSILPGQIDSVVITLVPNTYSEQGYEQMYITNLRKVLRALVNRSVHHVIFVSSTSVYGQNEGEWVDEQSATEPASFNGQILLRAEQLVNDAFPDAATIVRFSGIYGPGRERLRDKVKSGDYGSDDTGYSNRIHSEDCAAVLAHLLQKKWHGEEIAPLYLASDNEPVPLAEVKHWLAEQMHLSPPPLNLPEAFSNKRCKNDLLLASGYTFLYPNYKSGFTSLLP